MLRRLLKNAFHDQSPAPQADAPRKDRSPEIVLSLPPSLREVISQRTPGARSTDEVLRDLFTSARESIKVFSPYVDPSFTSLAGAARAPIQVVTTICESRRKSNPVLERFATTRPLAVRYLHEKFAQSQMFQLHAKMVLADRSRAYIGSANLTDTSLHYNLELGVYLEDAALIARLQALFDHVYDFAARAPGRP